MIGVKRFRAVHLCCLRLVQRLFQILSLAVMLKAKHIRVAVWCRKMSVRGLCHCAKHVTALAQLKFRASCLARV